MNDEDIQNYLQIDQNDWRSSIIESDSRIAERLPNGQQCMRGALIAMRLIGNFYFQNKKTNKQKHSLSFFSKFKNTKKRKMLFDIGRSTWSKITTNDETN